MRKLCLSAFFTVSLAVSLSFGQQPTPPTPGQEISSHGMSTHIASSGMKDMPGMDAATSTPAMHSMEGHHMDMGPHMKMTTLRAPKAGDEERAQYVVEAARQVSEKY